MRTILLLSIVVTLAVSAHAKNYTVEEFQSETAGKKPFSITRIEQKPGELLLWIESGNIAGVSKLVSDGSLAAQLSEGETAVTVPLSLFKAVVCKDIGTFHPGYSELLPVCEIEQVRYYLRTPVTLGHGRDLAIGLEPDFLWLIEEQ